MFKVTLPSYFGTPATPAEIVYLRDVLRAEFSLDAVDNPKLRGVWLFRRFRVNGPHVTEVWLQDQDRNIVAMLSETKPKNWR